MKFGGLITSLLRVCRRQRRRRGGRHCLEGMIAVVAVHRIVGRLSTRLRQELGVCQGTQSSVPTLPSEEHPSEQRPSQKSGRHTYPYNTVSDHIFRRYVQLELSGSSKSEQEHKEGRPQSHGSFLRPSRHQYRFLARLGKMVKGAEKGEFFPIFNNASVDFPSDSVDTT